MNDQKKTLTFAIMDAPFESARSTTAFRIMDAALRRGEKILVAKCEWVVVILELGHARVEEESRKCLQT